MKCRCKKRRIEALRKRADEVGAELNPDVERMSVAITRLAFVQAPTSDAAHALWVKWSEFLASPYYVAIPDTALYPVLSAFAESYAAVARALRVEPKDIDPRVLVLMAGDAQRGIAATEKALDQTLKAAEAAAKRGSRAVADTLWRPALIVGGVLLLVALAKR